MDCYLWTGVTLSDYWRGWAGWAWGGGRSGWNTGHLSAPPVALLLVGSGETGDPGPLLTPLDDLLRRALQSVVKRRFDWA